MDISFWRRIRGRPQESPEVKLIRAKSRLADQAKKIQNSRLKTEGQAKTNREQAKNALRRGDPSYERLAYLYSQFTQRGKDMQKAEESILGWHHAIEQMEWKRDFVEIMGVVTGTLNELHLADEKDLETVEKLRADMQVASKQFQEVAEVMSVPAGAFDEDAAKEATETLRQELASEISAEATGGEELRAQIEKHEEQQ